MKKLLSWFLVLVMLLGFYFPNFALIVSATDVINDNTNTSNSTFTNVVDDTIKIDMDGEKSVVISGEANVSSIDNCYVGGGTDLAKAVYDNGVCTINAYRYGKTFINLDYTDLDNQMHSKTITLDIDFDEYVEHLLNKIPDEYEYTSGTSFMIYLEDLLPSGAYVEFVDDYNNYCYSSVEATCTVELNVPYLTYVEGQGNNHETKKVIKNVSIVDKVKDNNGWYVTDHYVAVGETVELDSYGPGNAKDYFFVSEDNTIARIDSSNRVLGVAPGSTYIRIVNKETLEYRSFRVSVHDMYSSKTLDQVLAVFNNEVSIDISNNLNLYYGYEDYAMASRYFNSIVKNISEKDLFFIYSNGVYCADGIKGCYVDYYYSSNASSSDGRTATFDMVLRGVRVNEVLGYYRKDGNNYFVYNGDTLVFNSVENKETELRYSYDTEYFEMTEVDGKKHFRALKEGFTKIDLYATSDDAGYMTSIPVNILFTKEEVEEVNTFINSINTLNVPYTKDEFTPEIMSNYIKAYITEALLNNNVANYLNINVADFPDKSAELNIKLNYNGTELYEVNFYNKMINFTFSNEQDTALSNELSNFKKQIKDKYILDFSLSVKLASSSAITNEFYNNLYKQSNLVEDIKSDMFTTKVVYNGSVKYNNYLNGGAYYEIYIYRNNVLVDIEKTIVTTYFVVDRDVNDRTAEDLNYIKNYILDKTGLNLQVVHAFDDYYLVSYNDKSFYILYNYKDRIEAEYVHIYEMNDSIISVGIGETKQFNYLLSPFSANYYDLNFMSSNEDVFTVDKEGLITGVRKGIAEISYSTGSSIESTLVIVGQTVESYLNELAVQLPFNNIRVNYQSHWVDDEEAVTWAIQRIVWDYEEVNGSLPFNVDVRLELNKASNVVYFNLCVDDYCSDQYKSSYKFVGIYSNDKEYKVKSGQTIKANVNFTEGDISNLIFSINDEDVARVDKRGNITGIKKGNTYLSVFDKYHDYFYEFPVYVDYEDYNSEIILELNKKVYDVDGSHFNSYNSLTWDVPNYVMNLLNEEGFDPWSVLGSYSYSGQYDEDTGLITFEFDDVHETVLEVKVNLVGIYTSTNVVYLDINESYTDELKIYSGGEVSAVSANTDICTVNGITVTGVTPGICNVTYSNDGHSVVQSFVVGSDEMAEELDVSLENLPDTIDLKLDEFDMSRRAEWEYTRYYDAAVSYYLSKLYPENIGIDISQVAISTNGDEVTVSLMSSHKVKYEDGFTTVGVRSSDSKIIKLNYVGHTDGWEELGNNIKNTVKRKYILTADQMIEFMFSSGNVTSLHEYSNFETDLTKLCEECDYIMGGRGGVDGGSGVIYVGFEYFIMKDGEPIGYSNADFVGYIYLDLYEITDDEHIDREVKHKIREAYRKHKHKKALFSRFSLARSDGATLIDNEDYEVDLELISREGNIYNYNVEIDGKEFVTSVYLNIVATEKVYSQGGLLGDIDLDGNVNITDLVRLRKYLAGSEKLSTEQLANADVNKDNDVNITDLVKIRKYLAGSEEL